MWFLQIAEELLSNVLPVNRRGAIYGGSCESQRSYLMWFLRISEELSNVVPANLRGAI